MQNPVKRTQSAETLSGLLERYETALAEHGMKYSPRIRTLSRVSVIIRLHENQGRCHLNGEIVLSHIKEIDQKYYEGNSTKKNW